MAKFEGMFGSNPETSQTLILCLEVSRSTLIKIKNSHSNFNNNFNHNNNNKKNKNNYSNFNNDFKNNNDNNKKWINGKEIKIKANDKKN